MIYRLFHPHLKVDNNDFPTSWEIFCYTLIKTELRSGYSLERRLPKDKGVDFYCPQLGIAYQCKSSISGDKKDFNSNEVDDSFKQALLNRDSIPWLKYCLCINIDLSGNQIDNLKAKLQKTLNNYYSNDLSINLRDLFLIEQGTDWINICKKNPYLTDSFFSNDFSGPIDLLFLERFDKYKIFEHLSKYEYNFEDSSRLVNVISKLPELKRCGLSSSLEELIADLLSTSGTQDDHIKVLGLATNILSKETNFWNPSKKLIISISDSIIKILKSGETSKSGIIEPLAFSLSVKDKAETHREYLNIALKSFEWRSADINRVRKYYKSPTEEIDAYFRHISDSRRINSLLYANDINRIIENLDKFGNHNKNEQIFQLYLRLLMNTLNTLKYFGETSMVDFVIKFLQERQINVNDSLI